MGIKDILLQIDTYPDPTPLTAVDRAVEFAKLANARISALAVAVDLPLHSNRFADYLIGLSKLEKEVEDQSLEAGQRAIDHFTRTAKEAGVFEDAKLVKRSLYAVPAEVAMQARTRDLCIRPISDRLDGQVEIAIAAIFESGRPVLVYKPAKAVFGRLAKIVVAWDGSRCAARALAEAMPLLASAAEVRLVSVLHDKPDLKPGTANEALRHLKRHGIEAVADEVDLAGRSIQQALGGYIEEKAPDLFVMGAFGHSRLREFILGGATEFILEDPPVPALLAH